MERGQTLLHYTLVEKIGEGGMGVVWKAQDTTLNREVAIKILPAALSTDGERLARFEREARLLASLNHPNIAGVYGLHEADGVHFLAMELVPGEDLSLRLARGALPVDEALAVADSIAEALRAAHMSGVIHRDLKPANIVIGPEGEVKVLDFGLAKALAGEGDGSSPGALPSMSPTVTSLGTVAGVILGTAAYMSPEQARGKPVDRRADVWAFGCVLYEMLTGVTPFPGETITDTLAAVVRAEPDWTALPSGLPRGVTAVLELCTVKNPRKRLHDIADAGILIQQALIVVEQPETAVPPAAPRARGREGLAWLLAAAAIVTALVLWWSPGDVEDDAPLTRFTVMLADDILLPVVDETILALSPDGRTMVFAAYDTNGGQTMIYRRRLDQAEAFPVTGTEGGGSPFFSPDGESIAFFSEGKLKTVAVAGGTPFALADTPNQRGGVWLPDDSIVYSPEYTSGLWRVSAAGGAPELLVDLDVDQGERTFRWPSLLPGGRSMLFTVGSTDSPNNYDEAKIAAYDLDTGKKTIVLEGGTMARFAAPNRLIYARAGMLFGIAFDPQSRETSGAPSPVLDKVGNDPSSGAGYFDLSAGGNLIYVPGSSDTNAHLTLIDRQGEAVQLPLGSRSFHQPRFSPDGSQIAFTLGRGYFGVEGDVWIYSLIDENLSRVTFSGSDLYPLWTPDGRHITYLSSADSAIFEKPADGSGTAQLVVPGQQVPMAPGSWSPDGQTLAYTKIGRTTDIYLMTRGEEPRLFVENAGGPAFSPDGRFVAYSSPASGTSTVYVRPVTGQGQWQVSPDRGGYPRWPAGRDLFYVDIGAAERPLMAVRVADGPAFRMSTPRIVIPSLQLYQTATAPLMNWDTDSERFAFVEFLRDEEAQGRVEVALNWSRHLALGTP